MKIDYKKLFIECADAGISITKLMKQADVSKCTWIRIKNGYNVQAVTAGKLAKALNIPVEQLLVMDQE